MRILKLSVALFTALACLIVNTAPILQLGVTHGSYDTATEDVITTSKNFMLNDFGKKAGSNAAALDTNYYLSIAAIAAEGLNPPDFGSFGFAGTTYTLNSMLFGNPTSVYDSWFMQFSGSNATSDVSVKSTPGFDSLANPGGNYFYKSFNVNTQDLFAGYNLHFDLFSTELKKGDSGIASHVPFSHDASTAYDYIASEPFEATVPEPSSYVVFCLALAGVFLSRKLVWPPAAEVKDKM